MSEVRLVGTGQLVALGRRLGRTAEGKVLRRNLTRTIRSAAQETVSDVRSAVLAVETKGVKGGGGKARRLAHEERRKRAHRGGHGLRATIARNVKVRVKYSGRTTGVRIFIDKSTMPGSQAKLPRYLNDPRGWRHPVFGGPAWARQTGQEYWATTIRRHQAAIQRAVSEAVAQTLREM